MNLQIGSLWTGKDKNDNTYLSGEINLIFTKLRIGVFKNTNKEEGSKQPDFRVVILEDRDEKPTAEPMGDAPF